MMLCDSVIAIWVLNMFCALNVSILSELESPSQTVVCDEGWTADAKPTFTEPIRC